jgi:hypothetical protein
MSNNDESDIRLAPILKTVKKFQECAEGRRISAIEIYFSLVGMWSPRTLQFSVTELKIFGNKAWEEFLL